MHNLGTGGTSGPVLNCYPPTVGISMSPAMLVLLTRYLLDCTDPEGLSAEDKAKMDALFGELDSLAEGICPFYAKLGG